MIISTTEIKSRGVVPGLPKRTYNGFLKRAYFLLGLWWHTKCRPKHFTRAGAREYHYTPRQGERGSASENARRGFRSTYTGQKLRRMGHTLPLVWSGLSRAMTAIRNIRASFKGVKVVLNAPTLNYRRPGSPIDKRREMTTVSEAERQRGLKILAAGLDAQLRQYRGGRAVRIR